MVAVISPFRATVPQPVLRDTQVSIRKASCRRKSIRDV